MIRSNSTIRYFLAQASRMQLLLKQELNTRPLTPPQNMSILMVILPVSEISRAANNIVGFLGMNGLSPKKEML
jgi:hypothetical protein